MVELYFSADCKVKVWVVLVFCLTRLRRGGSGTVISTVFVHVSVFVSVCVYVLVGD